MGIKQRLIEYVKLKGLTNSSFQKSIGVSGSYIQNIVDSIGLDKLRVISASYPDLNTDWLLTGEGDMIKQDITKESHPAISQENYIPLIPISAQGGTLNDFVLSIKTSDCEKIISPIRGAQYAMPVNGDSMAPEYPSGSIVLLRKINEAAFIDWGKAYVLDTCNGIVIKILTPSEKDHHVRCISTNPSPIYAPFDINLENIFGIYRVVLCMAVK